ncbi:response regulator transcription factor [Paenibacillus spongiae]|uniref:Response regulator n=1 Tax=Paenibacillus spongiae TaxID=2909671 RepID=A0ABY5SFL8_9BACL|nr:response regulator [Paenibacillus spongiae]UVI31063.1 response regulator [Paenibacillus spongiae]
MYRVIIVDDEAVIRQGIKKILQRFAPEWEVVGEAEDGISGLQQILRLQPDLAILDIRMPGLTGIECCEQIADQAPRIHRIILTAYQDFQLAKQAIHYGVLEFITKPLDREELLRTLRKVETLVDGERREQAQLSSLRHTVRQAAPLAQQLYYHQFLFGHYSNDLEQFLIDTGYSVPFKQDNALVVLLAVSPDWIEKDTFSPFDVELFMYALAKFVQEWCDDQPHAFILQDHAGQLIVILQYPADSAEPAGQLAAQLASGLNKGIRHYFKRTVTIGISSVHSFADTPKAYQEASLAVTYRIVYGGDQVLSHHDLHAQRNIPVHLLEQMEASLEQLMQGNEQTAYEVLDEVTSSGRIGPVDLKRIIVHYMLRLAVQIKQMDQDIHQISGKSLQAWLSELESTITRDSLMEKIKTMIHELCRIIVQERNHLDLKLVEKAKQHVRDYLSEGVSLQSVADYLGMNASYFSRWFKYSTNGNFVDFLKECRIEKAKELIQQGKHTLQEISTLIGYADVKHFYRVFKERTGYSPSEYKKHCM